MKSTLSYVWDWYLAEHASDRSEREKELSRAMNDAASDLRELLNDEQMKAFEEYIDRRNEWISFCEEEIFIKGIRFATSYMAEALDIKRE